MDPAAAPLVRTYGRFAGERKVGARPDSCSAAALIEGMRPGVMERLGLGSDICRERNLKLVYGRMTGWGQHGPMAQAAGHDNNYISVSGALYYNGTAAEPPSSE